MTTLIGEAPAFKRLLHALNMVAATDVAVLFCGEPGTGKGTLARALHAASARRMGPLRALMCAGASTEALDLCLSGRPSEPSTLYLDEVGELDAEGQARLMHQIAIEDATSGPPAWRIIAASAKDLGRAVQQGEFRRDLYLRLCVVPLTVPALRDRLSDLGALTAHFVTMSAARHGRPPPRLTAGAERVLRRYHWPGNLRELANLCERLVILLPGTDVRPENLPAEMVRGADRHDQDIPFALPAEGIDLNTLEAELIRQALTLAGGNKSRAARLLGLTRDTLLYRLQKHLIPG
jgi:DNA-binding NtrC family response regulator